MLFSHSNNITIAFTTGNLRGNSVSEITLQEMTVQLDHKSTTTERINVSPEIRAYPLLLSERCLLDDNMVP